MIKALVLIFSLVHLAAGQITPKDLEEMKQKLHELENELNDLVPNIDSDTSAIGAIKVESIRARGGDKAVVECAELAAGNMLDNVHKIGTRYLNGLATFLEGNRNRIDSGQLSEAELIIMKQELLSPEGFYHSMVNRQIEDAKNLDMKIILEFNTSADEC